ncbi:MAG: type I phosphomannose isomerase catalytic subunit [Terracidiphilus sp.]
MSEPQLFSAPSLAPFRMEPRFDTRVWGFRDLRPWYNKAAGGEPIGEVWLTGDDSLVATGPHAGKCLGELFEAARASLLGPAAPSAASPLLIKVLFAREKLSVQVHPDDGMARKYGNPRGKTECWYCLAAEPGAAVAVGLKPGATLAQLQEQIRAGTLESSLNVVPVSAGDMIFVDAGTVHAIWPGAILLETQQNCDLTYRIFDYGRPRELHVEKSLEAAKLVTRAGKVAPQPLADRTVLIDVEYFRIERVPVAGSRASETLRGTSETHPGLAYLFAAAGSGRIAGADFEAIDLPARAIVAIPAASPRFKVENLGGLDLIRITPHWPVESE